MNYQAKILISWPLLVQISPFCAAGISGNTSKFHIFTAFNSHEIKHMPRIRQWRNEFFMLIYWCQLWLDNKILDKCQIHRKLKRQLNDNELFMASKNNFCWLRIRCLWIFVTVMRFVFAPLNFFREKKWQESSRFFVLVLPIAKYFFCKIYCVKPHTIINSFRVMAKNCACMLSSPSWFLCSQSAFIVSIQINPP